MKKLVCSFALATILLISGCKDDKFELPSELPEDLIGYQLVIYNTEVISNPDNLQISSRTVYYFESEDTIRGEGSDGSSLPTTHWEWSGGDPGDTIDIGVVDLYYEGNGHERYVLNWDGNKESIEERQTFTYYGALTSGGVAETKGYFEIEQR